MDFAGRTVAQAINAKPARPSLAGLLADGAWHRGPELAATLGVTRAAVSARAADLRARGLTLHAVAGRGYRLAAPLELLDAGRIRAALGAATVARLAALEIYEHIDSTSAALARRGDDRVRACFAEHQTAGRGRAGRAWVSPFAANLCFSVSYNLAAPRAPLGALSLAVGVRLAEALARLGGRSIGLKWPNDLWAGGRKLGGIVIQYRGEVAAGARLIVGVGLNVSMAGTQGSAIGQAWTRLAEHVPALPGRNELAARLLEATLDAVTVFETDGFVAFRLAWGRFDIARDEPVRIVEPAGQRCGIARGIGADGALLVDIDGQIVPVYSGDVSLRFGHG